MIHPIGCRENSRHRGPIESLKLSRLNNDIIQNLKLLTSTFDKLEVELQEVKNHLSQDGVYSAYNNTNQMYDQMDNIKEGIIYG